MPNVLFFPFGCGVLPVAVRTVSFHTTIVLNALQVIFSYFGSIVTLVMGESNRNLKCIASGGEGCVELRPFL